MRAPEDVPKRTGVKRSCIIYVYSSVINKRLSWPSQPGNAESLFFRITES